MVENHPGLVKELLVPSLPLSISCRTSTSTPSSSLSFTPPKAKSSLPHHHHELLAHQYPSLPSSSKEPYDSDSKYHHYPALSFVLPGGVRDGVARTSTPTRRRPSSTINLFRSQRNSFCKFPSSLPCTTHSRHMGFPTSSGEDVRVLVVEPEPGRD